MNNDLISREALREDLRRFFPVEVLEGIEPKTLFAQIMHDIDNAPTVLDHSVEIARKSMELGRRVGRTEGAIETERPQGEWVKNEHTFWTCSHCNWFNDMNRIKYNFCPNCGACMQKGGAE